MKKLPSEIKLPDYEPEKSGEYVFIVTELKVIKVGVDGKYGDPYNSMMIIKFIDGEAYIGSAIGDFTRTCFRTIFNYVKSKGIKVINYKRGKGLKDKTKKVKTN